MRRLTRFTLAGVAVFAATAAWAEKRDVIIQCASTCDAAAAAVAQLGGSVSIKYRNIPAIAASLPAEAVVDLAAAAGVKAIAKDVIMAPPTPPLPSAAGGKAAAVATLEAPLDTRVLGTVEIAQAARSQPADYAFNNTLINATPLQAAGNLGQGVIVGVIDTGTANSPVVPSLSGTVIGGENFVAADPVQSATSRANDPHGTWVGTVIASHVIFGFSNASTLVRSLKLNSPESISGPCPAPPTAAVCGVPMIGVAPAAKIYAIKVFDSRGGGAPESRVIAAMDRAITLRRNFNNGMPSVPVSGTGTENDPFRFDSLNIGVVNMSLGGPTLFAGRDVEDQLTQQMIDVGITLATSAGNDGFTAMTGGSPGSGFGSLTVGAASTTAHERILRDVQFGVGIGALFRPTTHIQTASFSSRGPTADGRIDPDVTANGFATLAQGASGGISLVSGTSFSSPTAAGAAALLRAAAPTATAAQVRNALVATANPALLGDGSGPIDQGSGFIDVAAAAAALATGSVSAVIPESNPNTGNEAVRNNVQHLGFDTVNFAGDRFTTHVSNLKPGQVTQLFVRTRIDTTSLVVNVSNVTPANAPAQQNALFGDDVVVQITDAPTSKFTSRGSAFVTADTSFTIANPQSGLVRVSLGGDSTNAGLVSADVEIVQQRDPLPKHTAKGKLSQGSLTSVAVDIPAGTTQALFELFWDGDWGAYPTNDADMLIVAPDGTVNAAGATDASPERAVLANPAPGRYTVVVNGFAVVGKDQFTLRALANGRVLDAAR
ncbi:MAG TPA: S8 family serine peptidase [Usitatibacter sp.]|nr:S8 family serine peptidase [Usitatibacter sp.]